MTPRPVLAIAAVALVLTCTVAIVPASAQVGVLGGLNLGTLSVSGDKEEQQFKLQPGPIGGLFFGKAFKGKAMNGRAGLQFELLFSQKGTRLGVTGYTDSIRINYIELPVLFTYLAKTGGSMDMRLLAGMAFGLRVSNSDSINGHKTTPAELTAGDIALQFGLQLERGKLFYGASYSLGLVNVSNDSQSTAVDSIKTRTLSVVVGWTLKKAK